MGVYQMIGTYPMLKDCLFYEETNMLKILAVTLVLSLFTVFIYDVVKYNIFKAKVKRGEFGAKYDTPRHIYGWLRNIGFVISYFNNKWRT